MKLKIKLLELDINHEYDKYWCIDILRISRRSLFYLDGDGYFNLLFFFIHDFK